jgi:hypothetical protein
LDIMADGVGPALREHFIDPMVIINR